MSDKVFALRPHHGMCLAYFIGEGYSGGFTAHMGYILSVLSPDTPVRLKVGTDVICSACPNCADGVCVQQGLTAAYDRAVLARCGLKDGDKLTFGSFAALVQDRILTLGFRGEICGGCQWNDICSSHPSRWAGK